MAFEVKGWFPILAFRKRAVEGDAGRPERGLGRETALSKLDLGQILWQRLGPGVLSTVVPEAIKQRLKAGKEVPGARLERGAPTVVVK